MLDYSLMNETNMVQSAKKLDKVFIVKVIAEKKYYKHIFAEFNFL